jgi:hypothetical protein
VHWLILGYLKRDSLGLLDFVVEQLDFYFGRKGLVYFT